MTVEGQIPMSGKNYLLDKFLVTTDSDDDTMALWLFKAKLSKNLWLIQPCCPAHGEELPVGAVVIDVRWLESIPSEGRPHALIFPDWGSVNELFHGDDDDPAPGERPPTLLN
jgi:hypothetical protein